MVSIKKLQRGNKPLFPPLMKKGKPTSLDEHVGYRIRMRRSLLGISQDRLASSVGITFQQMQKYERGVNRVSAGRLFEFSKLLDVPLTYFFEDFTMGKQADPYAFVGGLADTDQEGFEDEPLISENIMKKKETLDLVRLFYSIPTRPLRRQMLTLLKNIATRSREHPDEPLPVLRKKRTRTDKKTVSSPKKPPASTP